MPGLAGVYNPRANGEEIRRVLARMRRVLDIPSIKYTVQVATGPGIGCLNFLRGNTHRERPVSNEQHRIWLMLDGELYNADELRKRAAADVDRTPPEDGDNASLCLALYASAGASFVQGLNGQFNIVAYREPDRTLLIATDRYGYRPLFVAESGGQLLFATEMKAVISALDTTPRVDGLGILQIMGQRFALGDRTWLEPIRVVDPGTWLEVTPHGISSQRYFHLRFQHDRQTRSLETLIEGLAAKLTRATERVTAGPGRIGIMLSGGLDSRSMLLAMTRSGTPAAAYSFGDPQSRDVRYAQQLARVASVPHVHLLYERGYLGRVLSPIVWRTEGLLPFAEVTHTSLHFHRQIGARTDVILYGHCGDALTGAHLRPSIVLARSKSQLIERIFRLQQRTPAETLRPLFNPTFYRRYAPDLLDAMRATFTHIDEPELPDVEAVWDMENRQRRGCFHSLPVDRYRFEVRTPFLDNDLVDHLMAAPFRWRFQQRAYKKMIVTKFPYAAHVRWAYTGGVIQQRLAADIAQVGRNYIDKRIRRWWAHLAARSEAVAADEFRNLPRDVRGDGEIANAILDFSRSPSFPGEVFDRRGVEDIVRRHRETHEDVTHLVIMLATFATAYRLLLFDRPRVIPEEAQPVPFPNES